MGRGKENIDFPLIAQIRYHNILVFVNFKTRHIEKNRHNGSLGIGAPQSCGHVRMTIEKYDFSRVFIEGIHLKEKSF